MGWARQHEKNDFRNIEIFCVTADLCIIHLDQSNGGLRVIRAAVGIHRMPTSREIGKEDNMGTSAAITERTILGICPRMKSSWDEILMGTGWDQ